MLMVYQQYTNAINEAYRGRPDTARHAEKAGEFREWLESLEIDPGIRAGLVEQIAVLEEAFLSLQKYNPEKK